MQVLEQKSLMLLYSKATIWNYRILAVVKWNWNLERSQKIPPIYFYPFPLCFSRRFFRKHERVNTRIHTWHKTQRHTRTHTLRLLCWRCSSKCSSLLLLLWLVPPPATLNSPHVPSYTFGCLFVSLCSCSVSSLSLLLLFRPALREGRWMCWFNGISSANDDNSVNIAIVVGYLEGKENGKKKKERFCCFWGVFYASCLNLQLTFFF